MIMDEALVFPAAPLGVGMVLELSSPFVPCSSGLGLVCSVALGLRGLIRNAGGLAAMPSSAPHGS